MASVTVRVYLLIYNIAQAVGWVVALLLILKNLYDTRSPDGAFTAAGSLITYCQLASLLEVIHAATGLVRSGWLAALMQWAGRCHVLLLIHVVPQIQHQPSVAILFICWSLAELIRYPHYAMSIAASPPPLLTWLRYTSFIVLYPAGIIAGEMYLMYLALPIIKPSPPFTAFFSYFPFTYYHFLAALLLAYPFLGLYLFDHMLRQRRSKVPSAAPKPRPRAFMAKRD